VLRKTIEIGALCVVATLFQLGMVWLADGLQAAYAAIPATLYIWGGAGIVGTIGVAWLDQRATRKGVA
jgi:NADPH:quinone reductase-like Zn-dependent oxidoreductase